jgi:hypothetical protein
MPLPVRQIGVPAPARRSSQGMDFSQYGKNADQMRTSFEFGGFTPPGFGEGAPAPGAPAPGQTTNTAANSPNLQRHMDRYESRFDVDNTKRAIDKSNLGIMDAAALSAADQKANLSRRGVHGTEVGAANLQKNVFEPAQRAAANAASNIALQRERDLDALVLGGTGIMGAQDNLSLANRGLNLQQLNSDREDLRYRASQELEERRRREETARWQAMMGSLGSAPVPGVRQGW